MGRGDHPNSRKNLVQNSGRSRIEADKLSAKGGRRSGEVRRAAASFRECFIRNTTDEDIEAICNIVIAQARRGNLKAFELMRDMLDGRPTRAATVSKAPDAETIHIIEEFIAGPVPDQDEGAAAARITERGNNGSGNK